jgi:CheY-like chemotaxis protein
LSSLLSTIDYNVATETHGLDVLNKLQSSTPDIIVSDLNMPQMSGFEFLSVVRNRFPSIPVMAMCGIACPEKPGS